MQPPTKDYKESLLQVRQEVRDALKVATPATVARQLEKSGWSWEWACAVVETIEYKYNPAKLSPDAQRSQMIHDRLKSQASFGAGLFLVGLIVSVGTLAIALSAGGFVVIAYGAVFVGAGMWIKAYPQLKRYPDRPMPKYVPPRDSRVHDPMSY
ncbi:MAG: hypothetical protein CFE26_12310 [Verrucomicrobiales bacterium VVV1]|nr:MAG: hypothetical protein CFE26_12310 [Verrucomicrobiales bacterium VVV1]